MLDTSQSQHDETAGPQELLELADQFRRAAHALRALERKKRPVTRAPTRLAAIHSIELYLSALLASGGYSSKDIRRMNHDLNKRALVCLEQGLVLKKRTFDHLQDLTMSREYVVSRYQPELHTGLSQINRVMATLDEIAEKVARRLSEQTEICDERGESHRVF